MSEQLKGVVHRLLKWDGDGPIPDDATENPQKYPQVSEVIEIIEGVSTQVTYRRDPCP